jgi:erythromycin esterase-like protein
MTKFSICWLQKGRIMLNYDPDREVLAALEQYILPWAQVGGDYHPLIEAAQNNRFVLLGEATHGTADFYNIRAAITRQLIVEKQFDAVAVEADWPDAYRLNRYVQNRSDDQDADHALSDFERFPAWMWRNTEVLEFAEWLKAYNTHHGRAVPVGFYGLDLYGMTASMQAVLQYLDRRDPTGAASARERYSCFGQFINDPRAYGYAMASGVWESCEEEAVAQLLEMRRMAWKYTEQDGEFAGDEYFSAEHNAELVRSGEQYYRALYRGRPNTWNMRDRHMFNTLEKLAAHLEQKLGRPARIAVWAHNSHVGNAAATDMSNRGEINIGQLVAEKYEKESLRVGFSTGRGTVTAASDWDEPAETKVINEPLSGSYEELFSRMRERHFFIDLREKNDATRHLSHERLQRAIGVIYRPETERLSHYFYANLPRQFDFMIHINDTTALEPLAAVRQPKLHELEETYPYGL